MTDLVERIYSALHGDTPGEEADVGCALELLDEAADEITRQREVIETWKRECDKLEAERDRADAAEAHAAGLVEALKACVTAIEYNSPPVDFGTPDDPNPCYECRIPVAFTNEARAAYQAEKGE